MKLTAGDIRKHSIEAEMSLLSSILMESPVSAGEYERDDILRIYSEKIKRKVFDILDDDDFYDKRNALVYKAIKQSIENGVAPDFVILNNLIKDESARRHLFSLSEYLPAPINLEEYAKIVRKYSLIRKIENIEAERNLLIRELKTETDPELARKIRARLDELAQLSISINEKIDNIEREYTIKKYRETDEKPPILRCNGLLPEGYACVLAGSSGAGKTYIALTFAALYILETKNPALVWLSEDLNESAYRIGQMLKNVKLWKDNADLLKEKLRYVEKLPDPLITKDFGVSINTEMLSLLRKYIRDFGFIVLDPLSNFYGQEENNNTMMRMFMNVMQSLVFKTNKIILLTHHTNKVKMDISENNLDKLDVQDLRNSVRGASSLIDATRVTLFVISNIKTKSNGLQARYVVNIKSNVSKTGLVTNFNGEAEKFELPFPDRDDSVRNEW